MKARALTPERPGILRLTWPIFIELVLQMLVGNADQIMVGWYNSDSVGAIGNANQIINLLIIIFSVVCTSAMILIAQHIGAKATEELGETYTVSLLANVIFGGVVMAVLLVLPGPIYRAMQVDTQIFEETCLYTRIIAVGMLFQAVYLTFTAFFRSNQMMKESMVISVSMNVLNIAGNAVFINGAFGLPAMGAAGAALASDLSRLAGVIAIAVLFVRRFPGMLSLKFLRPFPVWQLRTLLHIGLPAGGESLSYNGSQLVLQVFCNMLPLYVVTTKVYANMFATVSYTFASAIGQAAQVVVANRMGAGDIEEVDRTVRYTLRRALLISTLVSALLFLFARPVYSLFTRDPQVLDLCRWVMLVEIPLEMGRAVNIVMSRSLQSCGDIRFPVVICVVSAWLLSVGGGFLLGHVLGLGLVGIWAGQAADECVRALLFLGRWKGGVWRTKRLVRAQGQQS
ncbi:MAG: MATE family efflux transporter [Candidatus Enterenecus sp.]